MPSFDIVSDVDMQEVDNALNQSRKEILTRFDFKGAQCDIVLEKNIIKLTADNHTRMKSLSEIVIAKLAKRNVPLLNIDKGSVETSSTGHCRQEFTIKRGLEHDKAKTIQTDIRASKIKVTCQFQESKIRVTGKSRDDLQEVISIMRAGDYGIALGFDNFRD